MKISQNSINITQKINMATDQQLPLDFKKYAAPKSQGQSHKNSDIFAIPFYLLPGVLDYRGNVLYV